MGLANISSMALASLINSYCLDQFSNLGCHRDLTFRNDSSPCCYVSCLNWQWLGETKTTVDSVIFAVTAIVGLVVFVAATVAIIAIKSKQKFPHLIVSYYILISVVSIIFSEAVGRLLGREKAICCDERDLLKALRSDACTFSIARTIIQNFCFTSGVSWCVVGFVNLWFAIVRSKSRLFVSHRNTIHVIEASFVWGTSFLLALIPYWMKGGGIYFNPLLCYVCSTIDSASYHYFSFVLPQQVIVAVGGFFAVHLVYTLKKQSFNRKKLFAAVQGQDAKQKKHVSQLDDLQRRFAFLLSVVFVLEFFVILNGFIVVMVRNSVDLDNLGGYVECVYLDLNDECPNKEKSAVENLTFAFLIVRRVAILCSLIFLIAFFWAAKDFRTFWKNAYQRVQSCCKRTRSDDKVGLDTSYPQSSERFGDARTAPYNADLELSSLNNI
ncbi:uncharacterized protein [Oscarella lobularis]|uniref:uncharacterized protein n=1 Tax=Oscarella lobularis TaxID=121494 RepID=UPI003314352B